MENRIQIATAEILHQHLTNMAKYIDVAQKLDEHEIMTAINDVTIYALNKMESGRLNNHDFNEYKDYLFVALKNQMLKTLNRRTKVHAERIITTSVDVDDIQRDNEDTSYLFGYTDSNLEFDDEITDQRKKTLELALKSLSQKEKDCIFEILANDDQTRISILAKYGYNKQKYMHIIRSIQRRIADKEKFENFYRYISIDDEKYWHFTLKEKILKLREIGKSRPEIASILNTSPTLISRAIYTPKPKKPKREKGEVEQQIKQLRAEGKSYREIVKIAHVSKSTINYYVAPDGKAKVQNRTRKLRDEKKITNFATMNRSQYYSITDIIKTYKISRSKLQKLVDDNKLQPIIKTVDLGLYVVTAQYFDTSAIDALKLERR